MRLKNISKYKNILIAFLVLVILFSIYKIYTTYAVNTDLVDNNNNTYNITLTGDNSTITVPSKSSKIVYYKLLNPNKGKVKYAVGYSSNNINVKVYESSTDPVTGTIDYGEYKFIKLKLINDSTSTDTVTLSTILGYENGGNLIVPSGVTKVTGVINKVNYLKAGSGGSETTTFLGTTLIKNTIERVETVDDNIVPTGVLGSFDVSKNNDGSIKLWYKDADNNNKYEVYIGSDNGKINIYSTYGRYLFSFMKSLKSVDLKYLDTSESTNMESFFYYCNSLVDLNLSSFDTSNVTNMLGMFYKNEVLENLDLSSFHTGKVTTMNSLLSGCTSLTSLDISNFDTSNVTDMYHMFSHVPIKNIDLSHFDTSNVTNMNAMFWDMTELETLNIANFTTSEVDDTNAMFSSVPSTTIIYVKNDTEKNFIIEKFPTLSGVTIK